MEKERIVLKTMGDILKYSTEDVKDKIELRAEYHINYDKIFVVPDNILDNMLIKELKELLRAFQKNKYYSGELFLTSQVFNYEGNKRQIFIGFNNKYIDHEDIVSFTWNIEYVGYIQETFIARGMAEPVSESIAGKLK